MADETTTVITLICERAAEIDSQIGPGDAYKDVPGVSIVKFPCSGMIQPLMIEAALNKGASGVIVCGCQIGDCYFREGNKMIRDRLLGERPPQLKSKTDRRRILAVWLSRLQATKLSTDTKEFVAYVKDLDSKEGKPSAAAPAKPAAKPTASGKPAVEDGPAKSAVKPAVEEKGPPEPAKDVPKEGLGGADKTPEEKAEELKRSEPSEEKKEPEKKD